MHTPIVLLIFNRPDKTPASDGKKSPRLSRRASLSLRTGPRQRHTQRIWPDTRQQLGR